MSNKYQKYTVLAVLMIVSGFVLACGGSSASSASRDIVAAAPVTTPTPVVAPPTAEPTQTQVPVSTSTSVAKPTSSSGSDEPSSEAQIAQGKVLFEKTAGGVGCALCHGIDALGDLSQAAPPNIGASVDLIEEALMTKPQMSFIKLTRDEARAVSAYLVWLKDQQ